MTPPATINLVAAFLPNGEVIHTRPEEAAVLNRAMLQAFVSSMLQKGLRALLNPPRSLPIILARLAEIVAEEKRRTLPPPPGARAAIAQLKQAPRQPAHQGGRYKPRRRTRVRSGPSNNPSINCNSPLLPD